MTSLSEYLTKEARALSSKHKVFLDTVELQSAAREFGLLAQIEVNHPSKLMKTTIPTEVTGADGNMRIEDVEFEYRVLMTEEEVIEFQKQKAEELLIEEFKRNPAAQKQFVESLGIKPAKPKATQKTTKKAAKKYKGAKKNGK